MPKEGKIQTVKYASPPPGLPVYGFVDPAEASFFGKTNYEAGLESKKFIFGIKRKDRRRHFYVIGKSGVGKSKLLELLIRQDIVFGHGLCLICPNGDLISNILDFIPEERIKDVILADPSDIDYPIYFNPLSGVPSEFKYQIVQGVIDVSQKQFGANWTPHLEYLLRLSCLALLDYPDAAMSGIASIITDDEYRQKVLEYIKDESVKKFWTNEFPNWSDKFNAEAVVPLINKFGQFFSNPFLRRIFNQKENKIDFKKIIDEQKIVLINLSKGKLGEENSNFLGSMFMIKIYQAAVERISLSENKEKDFYLYMDEFQDIAAGAFSNILVEAKKCGLALTLSHQYRAQVSQQLMSAIFGNVANVAVFRVGGDDAHFLEKEMAPVFKAQDMINLGMQEFYIKMAIDGEVYEPFSAETLNVLAPTHRSFKDRIIKNSRESYCFFPLNQNP